MITSKEALSKHKKLKGYWSGESRLSQQILIAILVRLEKIEQVKPKTKKWWKFWE